MPTIRGLRGRLFGACSLLLAASACGPGATPQSVPGRPAVRARAFDSRAQFLFMSGLMTPGKLVSTFADSNGRAKPVTVVTSHKGATFAQSYGITYDPAKNRIWITSCADPHSDRQLNAVLAFDADASGTEVQPEVSIDGDRTKLGGCQTGVAIGPNGDVYVADATVGPGSLGGAIVVFGPQQSGNAAPVRRIAGGHTNLRSPESIVIYKQELFVADSCIQYSSCGGFVQVFSRSADGNAPPLREIEGPNTQIGQPFGIALDAKGSIFVANRTNVAVFRRSADGNATPSYLLEGNETELNDPGAIALDDAGYLYVGSIDPSRRPYPVLVFKPHASGNTAPAATIRIQTAPWRAPAGIALK